MNPLNVIFEDYYLLVLDKPAGWATDRQLNSDSLQDAVAAYLARTHTHMFDEPVHRIDKAACGLVVFAKTKTALVRLQQQFTSSSVIRRYQALSNQVPEQSSGELNQFILKERNSARIVPEGVPSAQACSLSYTWQEVKQDLFLWEIQLKTGRFHQIRAQLASLNCPIVGDQKYGSAFRFENGSIALIAKELEFKHPMNEDELKFQSSYQWQDFISPLPVDQE